MIKSVEVEVNVHNRNKKYFSELEYVESDGVFLVKVEHLKNNSKAIIDVKCDYCGKIKTIKYTNHTFTINEYIKKDACENCTSLKREEILQYKLDNGLIRSSDKRGRWQSKDLILKELDNFVKEFGFVGRKEDSDCDSDLLWRKIKRGLKFLELSVEDALTMLGYDIQELQLRKQNGHYDDFDVLKNDIQEFINNNGKFPSQMDMGKELKIYNSYTKHGTLDEIKIKMGYIDVNDLVDKSGYINKSNYELVVANFLIENNITYKREQMPFKPFGVNKKYKSDFTFYLENDTEIHCEVWGGKRTNYESARYADYQTNMADKLKLYDKFNIVLISINPEIFNGTVKSIIKHLYGIFKPYLNLTFKHIEPSLMSTSKLRNLSDFELCQELLKYSENNQLPSEYKLRKLGKSFLFIEALKRYHSYADFARKCNVSTASMNRNQNLSASTG